MRIGSRSRNPLVTALLAAEAAGALTLPDVMLESRSRLADCTAAVSELRPPRG